MSVIGMLDARSMMAPRTIDHESAVQLHLDWLEHLEVAFERVMMRSLKRAVRPVVSQFGALIAQGEPAQVEPGEPFVSADDLGAIRTIWAEQVARELLPLLGDVYMTGAQGVSLAVAGVATDVPDVVSVGAQEWLALSQNRLTRVGDTAWLAARTELLEGFQRGESIDALAKRVRSTIEVTANRARTIARTEVIGASNAGAYAQASVVGVTTKTWLSTHDARTRPTHVRAGEQTVPFDQPFIVGGSRLRFPHDPFGPPGETVNCRCTVLFDDKPLCVCTPAWVRRETGPLTSAGRPDCSCSDDVGEPVSLVESLTASDVQLTDLLPERFHLGGHHDQRKHGKPGTPLGDSLSAHTGSDGQITTQRRTLHDQIVAGTLAGHEPVENPTMTFLGGGPASGKSSALQVPENSVVVNPDEVKVQLPEYKTMTDKGDVRASSYVHEESSHVAQRTVNQALASGMNVTLDGTGDSNINRLEGKIQRARNAGYRVSGRYVTVDTDEAVRRANIRGQIERRYVPESVIRETHASVSSTFQQAIDRDLFDDVELWDNNGSSPTLIGRKPAGGSWEVLDQAAWQSFLDKANV